MKKQTKLLNKFHIHVNFVEHTYFMYASSSLPSLCLFIFPFFILVDLNIGVHFVFFGFVLNWLLDIFIFLVLFWFLFSLNFLLCTMSNDIRPGFNKHVFDDTEFWVPERYRNLLPKGGGAQGLVW